MGKSKIVKVDVFRGFEKEIPQEKIIEFNGVEINVKQYLPTQDKEIIIDLIKETCFNKEKNGIEQYLSLSRKIGFVYLILKYYTNINLPIKDGDFKVYDIAVGSGLYDKVVNSIPDEEIKFITREIDEYVNLKLKEISNRSQVIEQLKEIVSDAIEKLPKEVDMKKLAEEMGKLDSEKAKMYIDAFNINHKKKK